MRILWVAFAISFVAGCGAPSHPVTFPVDGELFFRGQPATGARVILRPTVEQPKLTWPAGYPRGIVGSDGKFTISSFAEIDGAPAGDYVVLVIWKPGGRVFTNGQSEENIDPDDQRRRDSFGGRFSHPATSPLRVTVRPEPTALTRINLK